jgi:hypothetical protein
MPNSMPTVDLLLVEAGQDHKLVVGDLIVSNLAA